MRRRYERAWFIEGEVYWWCVSARNKCDKAMKSARDTQAQIVKRKTVEGVYPPALMRRPSARASLVV